jgi:hypothetical protein
VVDFVKEAFQVQVNDVLIAFVDIAFRSAQGLMSTAAGTKAITEGRKVLIENRSQYLMDGLLDEAVRRRGDTQQSGTSVRLGNFYAPDRKWAVISGAQFRFNA